METDTRTGKHRRRLPWWKRIATALVFAGAPGWIFGTSADSAMAVLREQMRDPRQFEVVLPNSLGGLGRREVKVDASSWPGLDKDPDLQASHWGDIHAVLKIAYEANGRTLADAPEASKGALTEYLLTQTDAYTIADALDRHEKDGLDAVPDPWLHEVIRMAADSAGP